MANVSRWKNFERQIALALGGKRRLRTMESFSKEATDVYFPKKLRKKFPRLNTVAIECKKRNGINIHAMVPEAKLKYGMGRKRIILASKRPATAAGRKAFKEMQKRIGRKLDREMKFQDFVAPLVTVELDFFKVLWEAWLHQKPVRFPRG